LPDMLADERCRVSNVAALRCRRGIGKFHLTDSVLCFFQIPIKHINFTEVHKCRRTNTFALFLYIISYGMMYVIWYGMIYDVIWYIWWYIWYDMINDIYGNTIYGVWYGRAL
jgi:hypothetical protein